MIDPNHPIVRLCVQGMRAEGEGRLAEARRLFTRAWETSTDDFEACIAAHYLARQQDTPQDTLRWNEIALEKARCAGEERVQGFYPSLYLNLGHAHEVLGNRAEAARFYQMAEDESDALGEGRYAGIVRGALQAARIRREELNRPA